MSCEQLAQLDPAGGRLRRVVSLPHAPARLPPARARGPRARAVDHPPSASRRLVPGEPRHRAAPSITRSRRATSTSPPRSSATALSAITGPAVERRFGRGPGGSASMLSRHAPGSPCWRPGRRSRRAMSPRRCASRTSPSVERSRAGRPTAPPRSRPGGRCSEPAWPARAPTTRWRTPPERSSSRGTSAPGATSRSGSWPSRASRSAIGLARTRPWPTRSPPPDRPATSRSATAVLGHRALVAVERGAWDAAAALIEESDAIVPAPQVDGYLSSVPSRAARIRLTIHRGDIAGARRELARATSLRPLLTAAAPAGPSSASSPSLAPTSRSTTRPARAPWSRRRAT